MRGRVEWRAWDSSAICGTESSLALQYLTTDLSIKGIEELQEKVDEAIGCCLYDYSMESGERVKFHERISEASALAWIGRIESRLP
jgi:hypothetical protein